MDMQCFIQLGYYRQFSISRNNLLGLIFIYINNNNTNTNSIIKLYVNEKSSVKNDKNMIIVLASMASDYSLTGLRPYKSAQRQALDAKY